jgi:hypothetical protein
MGPLAVTPFAAPRVLFEAKSPVIGFQLAQLSRHPALSGDFAERVNGLPINSETRD